MGSNPTEASHCITVGKLFTPTVPIGVDGQLNQLIPGTGTLYCYTVATPGKSFTCIGSCLLSLLSLIEYWPVPAGVRAGDAASAG